MIFKDGPQVSIRQNALHVPRHLDIVDPPHSKKRKTTNSQTKEARDNNEIVSFVDTNLINQSPTLRKTLNKPTKGQNVNLLPHIHQK